LPNLKENNKIKYLKRTMNQIAWFAAATLVMAIMVAIDSFILL
jgi:hypothetical protein